MPSLATTLWLIFAAATQPASSSPAPADRDIGAPVPPAKPTAPTAKATPSVAKPAEPKSPAVANVNVPSKPAPAAAQPVKTATVPPRMEPTAALADEPEEEIVAGSSGKSRSHRKLARKTAVAEPMDLPERKSPWTADRYAAVVPPGLTLGALRTQLSKSGGVVTVDPGTPPSERGNGGNSSGQALSDIEKAREALRQETARLESLLKTAGNCGVGGGSSGGEAAPATPVSAAALREAAGEQIDLVSKAMKGMKPEQAAAMITRLDRGLAAEILRRMKSVDAGAVLGLLKPELAAELATEIATRKPAYGNKKGGSK